MNMRRIQLSKSTRTGQPSPLSGTRHRCGLAADKKEDIGADPRESRGTTRISRSRRTDSQSRMLPPSEGFVNPQLNRLSTRRLAFTQSPHGERCDAEWRSVALSDWLVNNFFRAADRHRTKAQTPQPQRRRIIQTKKGNVNCRIACEMRPLLTRTDTDEHGHRGAIAAALKLHGIRRPTLRSYLPRAFLAPHSSCSV